MARKSKDATREVLLLPKPGQTMKEGRDIQTIEFEITNKTTIAVLKPTLQQYGLHISGNRSQLIERLHAFASDRDSWAGTIFQSAVKRSRGARTGARANTHSAKRIAEVFGDKENVVEYQSKRGADRSHRMLHESDMINNDNWANIAIARFEASPYNIRRSGNLDPSTSDATQGNSGGQSEQVPMVLAGGNQGRTEDNEVNTSVPVRRVERKLVQLIAKMDTLEKFVMHPLSYIRNDAVTALTAGSSTSSISYASCPTVRPTTILPNESLPTTSGPTNFQNTLLVTPREAIPVENLMIVMFDGGEDFFFDKTTVGDPPGKLFSNDLPRLFQEWHESRPSNVLVLNGRGIPVKLWPELYKKRKGLKTGVWDGVKATWGNWRFIVQERDRFASENLFWDTYSDEKGSRLGYQQILDRLKCDRIERDKIDAANARAYFGDRLDRPDTDGAFCYTKGGEHHLYTKDNKVAEKWRELLQNNEGVAMGWQGRQAMEEEN